MTTREKTGFYVKDGAAVYIIVANTTGTPSIVRRVAADTATFAAVPSLPNAPPGVVRYARDV